MSKIADFVINDWLGTTYLVEIYNENPTYVQPMVHFDHLDMRLIWDKDDKENLWGIYRHRIELTTLIKLSSHQVFINDLIAAKENDVWCTVSRTIGETTTEIFRGYLLMDTITIENSPKPFIFSFTFTDSLGKASEVDFSYYDIPNRVNSPVRAIITKCLNDLKIDEILGTTDPAFLIASNLVADGFESQDYIAETCLAVSGFNGSSDDKEQTILTPVTIDVVLTELCRLFNSVLIYADGLYRFIGLDALLDASIDTYYYNLLGNLAVGYDAPTEISNTKIELDHSDYKILKGGNITFLSPVRSIKCDYKLQDGNYLIGYVFDSDNLTTIQEIIEIEVTTEGGEPITAFILTSYFDAQIDYKLTAENQYFTYTLYKYTIKVNDYYYKRDFNGFENGIPSFDQPEWVESPSYYYACSDNNPAPGSFHIIEITGIIPESGIFELLIECEGLIKPSTEYTYESVPTEDAELISLSNLHNYLQIMEGGEVSENNVSYTSTNDVNNLKRLNHTGYFLEYGNQNSKYSVWMQDINGMHPTSGWSIGAGTVKLLQILTLESQTQFRQTIRRLYNMEIMQYVQTYLNPAILVQYDSSPINDNFILRLEHNCKTAETQLELMQLEKGIDAVDIEDLTGIDIASIKDDPLTIITTETTGGIKTPTGMYITQIVDDGDLQVYINGLVGNYFEGDIIKIHSPSFKQPLEVMLNADAKEGDTVLNVFEVDTTYVYPIGSAVIPNPRPVYKDEYFYPVSSAYIELTELTLPDETLLSLKAMRRKVRVWQNDLKMNYITHGTAKLNYNDFSSEKSTGRIHFKQALSGVRIYVEIEN